MGMWVFLVFAGCLEKVTGEAVPLDPRFTVQVTLSGSTDDTGAPKHQAQEHVEVVHQDAAPPRPFEGIEGEKITIAGLISSETTGGIDLDVSLVDKSNPSGLSNVGKLMLEGPGTFSLDVPIDVGDLHLAAFQDLEKDGPSEADPYAEAVVNMAGVDVSDVKLNLVAGARSANMSGPVHTEVPPPQPFADVQGDRVTISGEIVSAASGPVDMDVGRVDESAPGGMTNEGKHIFSGSGPFSFEVPVNIGDLRLAAFQDLEKDGPSDNDPYADVQVTVKGKAIEGLSFELKAGGRNQGSGGSAGPQHVEAPPGFGSGQAPPPDGTPTQADPFGSEEGERVTVSGLIVWDGNQVVDLDLFTPDTAAGGGSRLLGKLKKNVGAFRIEVPVRLGVLELDAFADLTGDGPTGDDPRATIRNIQLTGGPVTGIQVSLSTLAEDAPQPIPVESGTDIEAEFAKTVGGGRSEEQKAETE